MVVTFLAANNKKPKTIYLKPKDSGKEKKDPKKNNNIKVEKSDSNHDESDKDEKIGNQNNLYPFGGITVHLELL